MGKREKKDRKAVVLDTLSDLVGQFLYYDRKEDEDLPTGAIEKMIDKGQITVDELVEVFKTELTKGLGR